MKYKNECDNRYRVKFMRATEELMDQLTAKEFISYLESNAEFEDNTCEYIDGKVLNCKAYDLKEENSNLHKEFLVTEDGRVFYWLSLIQKIELVDREEKQDFTTAKEGIDSVIEELNSRDEYYAWKAVVKADVVEIIWGFQSNIFLIVNAGNNFIEAQTKSKAFLDDRLVGSDGNLSDCVTGLINSIYQIADERF